MWEREERRNGPSPLAAVPKKPGCMLDECLIGGSLKRKRYPSAVAAGWFVLTL
jgi:hypothetical protein